MVVEEVKRLHRSSGPLQNSVKLYFSMLPSTFPCTCHMILKLTPILAQKSEGVQYRTPNGLLSRGAHFLQL